MTFCNIKNRKSRKNHNRDLGDITKFNLLIKPLTSKQVFGREERPERGEVKPLTRGTGSFPPGGRGELLWDCILILSTRSTHTGPFEWQNTHLRATCRPYTLHNGYANRLVIKRQSSFDSDNSVCAADGGFRRRDLHVSTSRSGAGDDVVTNAVLSDLD
ncbi:hypothetical protein EVAR_16484_1 [Eumeta japonica]|uniref:Uncharacterized protein n=1 Tax=Eumeta variegata TaxID=151549 RepID=A0A4C1ULQ2_EUMVA|nr:hypothetical protein EVAR_16484_1 [Eumeta japonica]